MGKLKPCSLCGLSGIHACIGPQVHEIKSSPIKKAIAKAKLAIWVKKYMPKGANQ